jgi:hypothetical protein
MELPAGQVDAYDELLCKAAPVFTDRDWRLLISGEKAALFDTLGAPPGLQRRLLHVWSIPDFNSLPQVMAYAADDESYVQAQEMTINEMQNLYTALLWDSPIGLPDTPVSYYMMETLQMVNAVQARGEFATYMNQAVYSMNAKYGWKILMAGNAATGLIDQYVNLWGMADTTKLEAAIKEYRSGASWVAAVTHVATSLWIPRPLPGFGAPGATAAAAGAG